MNGKILNFGKRFFGICLSIKMTIVLLVIYAFLCALATFIENDFGVYDAKYLIYNTIFFDIIHILLTLNLIGAFIVAKPWNKKKYASMLFHSAFIVIVIGAGITRYFGFEGVMHIRENDSSDIVITQDEYIIVLGSIEEKIYKTYFPIHISGVQNYAQLYHSYLPSPIASFLSLVFNKEIPRAFEDKTIPFGDSVMQIKFKDFQPAQPMIFSYPMLKLEVSYKDKSTEVILVQNYVDDRLESFILGDAEFALSWGPRPIKLPFALHLEKFEIERYPGSASPSSYASEVIVNDEQNKVSKPYRIFMNNVLDYNGFRFFQSSYDDDEKGTILSVNKDPGKIPTYIGYAMLICGLLWSLFSKQSRVYKLFQYLKKQHLFSFVIVCFVSSMQYAHTQEISQPQEQMYTQGEFIINRINAISKKANEHSKKFATLIVQDFQGRNKPIDTLAMDLIHKITKKNGMFGLNHTELLLAMLLYYEDFHKVKIISTSTPKLREVIGTPKDQKHIAISDVYEGNMYKLANYVQEANRKDPSMRDVFDKDVLSVNERINIALAILNTDILRIFPDSASSNWLAPADAIMSFSHQQSAKIREVLESYFTSIDEVLASDGNDWSKADSYLMQLKEIQKEYGSALIPSDSKISVEIALNHLDIFKNLAYVYMIVGVLLFIVVFIAILRNNPIKDSIKFAFTTTIIICIVLHTLGLALRWYVGGHAPWSNAYESMIYISWAGSIAGVAIIRSSLLIQAMAVVVAGITLFVAHLGFMDPQIGTLMPVLKSYWLNIHVSVITASYGFFALCFVIGIMSLLFFILRSPKYVNIDTTILNLYCVNEISMIIGISLLTTGNFLGGVWANESWGRYWGWDPKETWSLICIVVYAIALHLRFIAKLNTPYIFAVFSVVAFYSVLMTYFGVNFYLSGKHSYATGEGASIPLFVYIMLGVCVALIFGAFWKRKLQPPQI